MSDIKIYTYSTSSIILFAAWRQSAGDWNVQVYAR